jgi:Uma2 family endonuclease
MATIPTEIATPTALDPPVVRAEWTVAALLDQLGGIPPERVLMKPYPGTATENDILEMDDRGGPLCELIDGTLVEKAMGFYEAWLAGRILHAISSFLETHDLGIVTGPDGYLRLFPKQVRAPDVAFIRREQLPGGRVPRDPIPMLAPTLPIEVISPSNTHREMERKLREYFLVGAELVWYFYPESRSAIVYTSPEQSTEIGGDGVLSGGDVLPGFELPLQRLFSEKETSR